MTEPPPARTETGVRWSDRIRRLFHRKEDSGDTITATVGQNARGVVVGKNIVQIGTLVVPTLPLLALPVLVLLAAAAYGLSSLGPARMTGSFNLAVAGFGQADASGRVRPSETGTQLSLRLFEGLQSEFENLPPGVSQDFRWQIWHDSQPLTEKRVRLGLVSGESPAEREQAACRLAGRINAHVIIYGNLPPPGTAEPFQPEFAICEHPELRVDTQEIAGSYQSSAGIPSQILDRLGNVSADLAVNITLNAWSRSLAAFTIGILYDLQGRPDLALDIFEQARDAMGAEVGAGAEVLWFFIGRENLFLERLPEARSAFEQALSLNPGYARAHIGLGGIYYLQALQQPPIERLDSPDLEQAIQAYQQAIAAAPDSPGALLAEKGQVALAGSYLLQGEAYREHADFTSAQEAFDAAIEAVLPVISILSAENQYRLLAQAHQTLGAAYHEQGHLHLLMGEPAASRVYFEQAIEQYEACIRQKDMAFEDAILRTKVVDALCIPYRQAAEAALNGLQGGTP